MHQTIFSTGFFNWKAAADSTIVSGYIWIFIVIAVSLTTVTVGAWYFATRHARNSETAQEESYRLKLLLREIV